MAALPPEKLARYRASVRQRQAEAQQTLLLRQQRGRDVAKQAALLLKSQFGATRELPIGNYTSRITVCLNDVNPRLRLD